MLIAVLLFILLLFMALNFLYKHTNAYREQFIDVQKSTVKNDQEEKLQIVNLGSNQPKFAFDYSNLPIRGENWAVGPQTLEYDFAILRHSVSRLEPGAAVCIPVCLLQFFLYRHKDRSMHIKYYTCLGKDEMVGYSKMEYLSNIVFPLLGNPKRLKRLIRDSKKDVRSELTDNPMKTEAELKRDAEYWIKCWNWEFDITIPDIILSETNRHEIEKNIEVLRNLVKYCREQHFKPVVVLLPATDYLLSRFSDAFLENHVINYIRKADSEAPLMNYIGDERFTSPDLYFNSFFMNQKGRKLFTGCFIEDLKKTDIL